MTSTLSDPYYFNFLSKLIAKAPKKYSDSRELSASYLDIFSEVIVKAASTSSDSIAMKDIAYLSKIKTSSDSRNYLDDLFSQVIAETARTSSSSISHNVEYIELLIALLLNPSKEIVEDGFLEELESLARHLRNVYDSFRGRSSTKAYTELYKRINSALRPIRMWSDFYSLLPDKKSIEDKKAVYDELLTRFPMEFANVTGDIRDHHRKELFKKFISLYRKIRPIIDSDDRVNTYRFPRTGHLRFVDHLVQNIEELVKAEADPLGPLKPRILQLQEMLPQLLRLIGSYPTEDEEYVQSQNTGLARWSYEAEIAIDSYLIGSVPISFCLNWLLDIISKLKTDMEQFKLGLGEPKSLANRIKEQGWYSFMVYPILVNSTNISEELREVMSDPIIRHMFQFRSWCLVSSYRERKGEMSRELVGNASYRRRGNLQELINNAYTCDMNGEILGIKLFNSLLKNIGYLIILEDVPDVDALNYIARTLPTHLIVQETRAILFTTPSAQLAALYRDGLPLFSYGEKSREDYSTSQTNEPTADSDVVGFKAETKSMLVELTGEPKELNIISIVGMGGQGKTTLAKKLYNDPLIVNRFGVRAWCSVSQVYRKRELLVKLLGQVGKLSDSIHNKNNAELAHMLWKSLTKRRFLIVLDDIWSIKAWDALQKCFPDDKNGSRIIFTTRLQELASQANYSSMLQPLGLLSVGESLQLLRNKINCPPELLGIAGQIAECCKGLPISIVLIAGLLEKIEKKEDQWEKIAKSLSSHTLGDTKELGGAVIELSYRHLPDHLKSCLLYLGAFLEDKEIQVSKLIRLWVAERFIKHDALKSSEDIAKAYLMDLISRSLVTVAQTKSSNGVKSCLIHDIIRDFCLTKAWKENILELIHG